MSIGIRNAFRTTANQPVAASTVLVDITGLPVPIAANQVMTLRYAVPFSVGATGGFKFQLQVPAAGTAFTCAYFAFDGVTVAPGSQVGLVQTASAPFANAWAVAGNHLLIVEATIVNGATAGTVTLQFACNSAANAINTLAGSNVEVTKYN